jgi:hypothetical protein
LAEDPAGIAWLRGAGGKNGKRPRAAAPTAGYKVFFTANAAGDGVF